MHVDVHPVLYNAIMKTPQFSAEYKMVALSHLLDNKSQGLGFVMIQEPPEALAHDLPDQALVLVVLGLLGGGGVQACFMMMMMMI